MRSVLFVVLLTAVFLAGGCCACRAGSCRQGTKPGCGGNQQSECRLLNKVPAGFEALFNGEDLSGWKRHENLPGHGVAGKWTVEDGAIVGVQDPPGKGGFLTTLTEYRDFELLLDTKIDWPFDSGVFLRTGPAGKSHQVTLDYRPGGQIGSIYLPWTRGGVHDCPEGVKHFKKDEWNHIRIICRGEPARIKVWVNGTKVTDFQHTEETTAGVPEKGTISLQVHPGGEGFEESKARFRNIFIRELPRMKNLFNGKDLTGWEQVGDDSGSWVVEKGILRVSKGGGGWLSTTEQYDDFKLSLEFRVPPGGNSGVFLRAPREGNPAYAGMEVQVLDDRAEQYATLKPWQYTGSIYGVQAPSKRVSREAAIWQQMEIVCDGSRIKVRLNGDLIIDTDLAKHDDKYESHAGLQRHRGYIGLQNHGPGVEFRNISLLEL